MGTLALAEKLCPDCGKPMNKDGVEIWKCPDGHGEWLRNEKEKATHVLPKPPLSEKRFEPLTGGLSEMKWRTAEKPVLQGGAIILGGGSKCKSKKNKKVYKPLITERYILP